MTSVDVRRELGRGRVAQARSAQALTERGVRRVWPLCIAGLGLLATLAWIALLGWLLCRAFLRLIE